jgi:hypothetical protein
MTKRAINQDVAWLHTQMRAACLRVDERKRVRDINSDLEATVTEQELSGAGAEGMHKPASTRIRALHDHHVSEKANT